MSHRITIPYRRSSWYYLITCGGCGLVAHRWTRRGADLLFNEHPDRCPLPSMLDLRLQREWDDRGT